MAVYYHYTDESGQAIASNLPDTYFTYFKNCSSPNENIERCQIDGKKKRHGKLDSVEGTTYILSDEIVHVKSSRLFKEVLHVHHEFLPRYIVVHESVIEYSTKLSRRILHNLTSINGHMIQELYSLVPQEALTVKPTEQIDTIKEYILKDPDDSARTFLRLAKLNAAAKIEFSVTRNIYDTNPTLQFKYHPIRKVILNLFHIFFDDFKESNVYVDIPACDKYIQIDYESFHVCLYHIIENATKYILPGTRLHVKFDEQPHQFTIKFDMISMRIEPEELPQIYEEDFSGAAAIKTRKAGSGIGMFRAHLAISLNKGSLETKIRVGDYRSVKKGKVYYDNNVFEIRLPLET